MSASVRRGLFRLDRFTALQAGQRLTADHEHRHPDNACLLIGVLAGLPVGLSILPGAQGLLELLLVHPDLPSQPRQHVDLPDVLPLHEESLQDSVVLVVALAVFPGVLVALEGQVGVRMSLQSRYE
jgi:hypothetical protein